MDYPFTIAEAAAALRSGQVTSTQLTLGALDRIRRLNDSVGAFITVTDDLAMAMAQRADVDFAAGIDRGPLQGIPFAIKDLLATKDAPTTANSLVLDRKWGEGYDAIASARIRSVGAVLLGKLVLSEFALGPPDPEKGFPIPRNPWDLDRTAGGSSSGTGIAVSTGMILGGLGTDTGGSVRIPAANNSHTGLKVTYGRVPKWGCAPLGYTLDSIGPMARTALDCALILNVIAGHDASDPTAATAPVDDYAAGIDAGVRGLRVGVPTEYFYDHPMLDPEVKAAAIAAVDVLRDLGADVREVNLPHAALAKEANTMIMITEAFAYHRLDMASPKWRHYGAQTRMMIGRGALYTAADYVQAQRFRSWFCRKSAEVMADVDVLVTPTMAEPPGPLFGVDPAKRLLQPSFTGVFNLTGYPALALPAGFSSGGLPLSVQFVGAPFAEATILRAGHAFQQETPWHLNVPAIAESSVREMQKAGVA
ncbi:MAG: amidase [Dehalococcoidia bacterium]|nr:MAG: amidase [Dehalococcoidia bacterium]